MGADGITTGITGAFHDLGAFAHDLMRPTLRLGVTGLARSGKTVFITALIHNLLAAGRLPFFDPVAQGRLLRAYLEPQPDDAVPRFDYERHLADLTGKPPRWPESTRRLAQLRLTLEFEPRGTVRRAVGLDRLHVDIVDYPGEWLLDLPLLEKSYAQWSAEAIAMSGTPSRSGHSAPWRKSLRSLDNSIEAGEAAAERLAGLFKDYLRASRGDPGMISTVPPGRFLMPGELEGSPALTFSPLPGPESAPGPGSLWAMMERRFEAYKTHVVKPFFRDHFARLDRQIVLVDALTAVNGGPAALADLQRALEDILSCFRPGASSWLSRVLFRRIDRILFAATKADHLHHSSHDRLEAILAALARAAMERAAFAGADVHVLALASVRSTREGKARAGGDELPVIIGRPLKGEKIGRRVFDGDEEYAIFPGDLPEDPQALFETSGGKGREPAQIEMVRFRPPDAALAAGQPAALPHIRLDRAMNFLIGDRLR